MVQWREGEEPVAQQFGRTSQMKCKKAAWGRGKGGGGGGGGRKSAMTLTCKGRG